MSALRASLAWRYTLAAFAVLVAVVLLLAAFWQGVYGERIDALRDSRFQFSLRTVKATLESGLRLGFAAADLPRAQGVIDPLRARQRDILSIDVFDPEGRVLFSTDEAGVGDSLPVAWSRPCLQSETGEWRGWAQDSALQCVTLVDGFERVAGGVLLRHRLLSDARDLPDLAGRWPWLLLCLLALTAGVTIAGWRASRVLQAQAQARLDMMRGAGKATTVVQEGPPLATALVALAGLDALLNRTEAEADEIDRMEAA